MNNNPEEVGTLGHLLVTVSSQWSDLLAGFIGYILIISPSLTSHGLITKFSYDSRSFQPPFDAILLLAVTFGLHGINGMSGERKGYDYFFKVYPKKGL